MTDNPTNPILAPPPYDHLTLAELEPLAQAGDADALIRLANIYEDGDGVEVDLPRAISLYEQVGQLGHPAAWFSLALLYQRNETVQDYAKARRYYEKAANLGYATAATNLGYLWQYGLGGPQDFASANRYYHKAGELGDPLGWSRLGAYYAGFSTPPGATPDWPMAIQYFKKATQAGSTSGWLWLGMCYCGESSMQDYAKARECYRKALTLGEDDAAECLDELDTLGL